MVRVTHGNCARANGWRVLSVLPIRFSPVVRPSILSRAPAITAMPSASAAFSDRGIDVTAELLATEFDGGK